MRKDIPQGFSIRNIPIAGQGFQTYDWTPEGFLTVTTDNEVLIWHEKLERPETLISGRGFDSTFWSKSSNWFVIVAYEKRAEHSLGPPTFHVGRVRNYQLKWSFKTVTPCYDLIVREDESGNPLIDIAAGKAGLLFWKSGYSSPKRAVGKRPNDVICLSESGGTGLLASGFSNGEVVLEGPEPDRFRLLKGHDEVVRFLAWSHGDRLLASGSNDGMIQIWDVYDVDKVILVKKLDVSGGGGVGSIGFTPDDRLLVAASFGGMLSIWRTDTWEEIEFERDYDNYPILGAREMKFSPTDARLASSVGDFDAPAQIQILDIDANVLLGEAEFKRDIASSPSQADELAEIDLLGRQNLVDSMAAMLSDPKQGTPFSIGIFGDWGTGKSSFFQQLQDRLQKDQKNKFYFAWFNAWEFEHTGNLPAGLAQQVIEPLSREGSLFGRLVVRIRYAWESHRFQFVGGIFAAFLAIVGALLTYNSSFDPTKTGWQTGDFMATGGITLVATMLLYGLTILRKVYQHPLGSQLYNYLNLPKYGEHLGLIPVLKKDIRTLCKIRLGCSKNPKGRLIVFVDDLDRCAPSSVLHVLEAIRLIMDASNVIILVAIDARMTMQAISNHYKDLSSERRSAEEIARDYLGKIFQLALTLNLPHDIQPYIEDGLFPDVESEESQKVEEEDRSTYKAGKGPAKDDNDQKEIPKLEDTVRIPSKTVNRPQHSTEQILQAMEDTPEEVKHFAFISKLFKITNPRLLRRLRNSYRILKVVERTEGHFSLMNMLFWYEYLYALPTSIQIACENHFRNGTRLPKFSTSDSPENLPEVIKFVKGEFAEQAEYERVRGIVTQLVLPRRVPSMS